MQRRVMHLVVKSCFKPPGDWSCLPLQAFGMTWYHISAERWKLIGRSPQTYFRVQRQSCELWLHGIVAIGLTILISSLSFPSTTRYCQPSVCTTATHARTFEMIG